jgi:pimeloyl-ACP methyl ester carboxylesterase
MTRSSDQAERTRTLRLTFPVIVLSADHSFGDPRADAVWRRLHAEVASAYPNGVVRGVASSHMIPIEQPDAVAEAITELVRQARAGASTASARSR